MYVSVYELKKSISDYQISLLLFLKQGSLIVTNEGTYFRAWLETNGVENKKVLVRKDVADNMLSMGLIEIIKGRLQHLYYYGISSKGNELLGMLEQNRVTRIRNKLIQKGE